mgnify:FL=1
MYYLTAGLLAKNNPDLVLKTGELMSFSAENLNNLTILNAFMDNLVPVTIGNLVGGALFIGALYWWAYKKVSR